jgi:hypothetical protein
MGYFSLDIKKAKGSSDTVQSDHIERRIIPKNADPTRTHLNRVLIEYPDGVHGRDEAIAHRLNTAGIKRKITHDQVRVVRVVLSGTHEDMMDIQENGRLDEWCSDSIQWLQATFGRENVVAAHLHMDEKTPHIHAAIVPIVTGERRKAKKEQEDGKRKYHKKANTVRLCADDLFNRQTLIAYHDNYARVMAKYGLQRGVRGSEARHTTTTQYYRDIQKKNAALDAENKRLQEQKTETEQELRQAKKEVQTEKLKGAATTAATNIAESVGSLFGSNKVKTLERENTTLYREVATHEETIEILQNRIHTMQTEHNRQLLEIQQNHRKEMAEKSVRHKDEVSGLKRIIEKLCAWFPMAKEIMRIESLCRLVGFNERQTTTLTYGKPLIYEGKLYSEEHNRSFTTERAGFQVVKDPADKSKLTLVINRQPIGEWFREQFDRLRQSIRQPIQPQRKSRGIT